SIVNDDFGDVLGVFYGLQGEAHSYRELEDQAKFLKNELLKIKNVAKIELYGIQNRTIEVTLLPAVMAQSGITTADLAQAFEKQNKVIDAGAIENDENRLRIEATGNFTSLEEIGNLTITSKSGEYFRLGEIAEISEAYTTPARNYMKINNTPAIGIAISTVADGNVVEMAEWVKTRIGELKDELPAGYTLTAVYDQGYESAVANNGFILNLIISVITVVAILLFFIGLKNGLLVGSGLVFSIFATLIYMYAHGIALQRMSLAAIIISMGMLVDNAIVVSDLTLMNMQRGMRKRIAILRAVSSTAIPLLAATLIAILTFMPVYLSPDITGEILSSFFIVIAVSLLFSWVFAITQTPFYLQEYARRPRKEDLKGELYQGRVYNLFRTTLGGVIRKKYWVIGVLVVLLGFSAWGFRFIPNVFMPQLDKKYFTIDLRMPEGTRIERMDEVVAEVTDFLQAYDQTRQVSTFIGQTPPRYYLANAAFGPQSNYAQCLVEASTPKESRAMQQMLRDTIHSRFPELYIRVNRFELSPIPEALIEARFRGSDPAVLDSLTEAALAIMRRNPKVTNAHNEWGNMAMKVKADYDPVKAGKLGIGKNNLMEATRSIGDGVPVGIYREGDKKVPVLLKSDVDREMDLQQLGDFAVWNGTNSAPLSQLTKEIGIDWEYTQVRTYNRELSMAAMCDVRQGSTMKEVQAEIREEIENIPLPDGYSFFWDSQFKTQKEGMEALVKYFPLALLLLVLILVALFRNFKQPLIIFAVLPLSIIGMVVGLLLTGFEFGFFCIAGWLGLLGMIIKNVIVLMDEVNIQRREGVVPYQAIIEATVSRARPVLMAATTTICGMIPLLFDVVFGGMAATIVFGLTFATLLTLFVTPALYAMFYHVKK
ncbi:MAG: efflux RND transporter permease subunit, partial [Tannerellaceae bacterium]